MQKIVLFFEPGFHKCDVECPSRRASSLYGSRNLKTTAGHTVFFILIPNLVGVEHEVIMKKERYSVVIIVVIM